jgi:hypothetical protein
MKQKELEKLVNIIDLIIQAERKQVNQLKWLNSPAGVWFDRLATKTRHEIKITDMAINRLKNYYNNQLKSLRPIL